MTTEYTLTITALCPVDLMDAGNTLVACITNEPADLRTFTRATHTDGKHEYCKVQAQAKASFLDAMAKPFDRPAFDTDEALDMEAANNLHWEMIVMRNDSLPPELDGTKLIVGVNFDPTGVLGLEAIPDE